MKITILDPDGDHVAPYVDGKLRDADNGLSKTSRFLDWLKDQGIALPFEIEYRHVDLTESEENRLPPKRLPKLTPGQPGKDGGPTCAS